MKNKGEKKEARRLKSDSPVTFSTRQTQRFDSPKKTVQADNAGYK